MNFINLKIRFALTVLVASILGCENKITQYEYTMYQDGYIRFWRDSVYDESRPHIENGDFVINTPTGDILMAGKYQNGFKTGIWEYHPNDTETVIIDWAKYHADDYHSVEINYPKKWTLIESKKRPFQATFQAKSKVKEDKYFIILSHKKSDLEMNLNEYWEFFNKGTHSGDSVISHMLRKFAREDGNYYFSTYTIVRNNEEMFLFSFLGETDSMIYDITYSSLKEDIDRKYIIFLDMIRSLKVERERFFTPFGQTTKIIELKWPPEPEVIS